MAEHTKHNRFARLEPSTPQNDLVILDEQDYDACPMEYLARKLGQKAESHAPEEVRGFQGGRDGGRERWAASAVGGRSAWVASYRSAVANSSNGLQQDLSSYGVQGVGYDLNPRGSEQFVRLGVANHTPHGSHFKIRAIKGPLAEKHLLFGVFRRGDLADFPLGHFWVVPRLVPVAIARATIIP